MRKKPTKKHYIKRLDREIFPDDASYKAYNKSIDYLEATIQGKEKRAGQEKLKEKGRRSRRLQEKKKSQAKLNKERAEKRRLQAENAELRQSIKALYNDLADALNVTVANSNKPPSADSPYHKVNLDKLIKKHGLEDVVSGPPVDETVSDEAQSAGNDTEDISPEPDATPPPADDADAQPQEKKPGKAHHPGVSQKLIEPTRRREIYPQVCPHCGCSDFEHVHEKRVQQFIDIVDNLVDILHLVIFEGTCANCGRKVVGKVPKRFEQRYGPGFHSLMAWLNTEGGVTRRHLQEFCEDFLNIPISQGGIENVLRRVSEAILPHYDIIAKGARGHGYNHMDETSSPTFGPAGKRVHWMWLMCNESFAFFKIDEHRSKEAFLTVIGPWRGTLISDDYGTYVKWENGRQTCLAHLKRAAKKVAECRERRLAECGEWLYETIVDLCRRKGKKHTAEEVQKIKDDFLAKAQTYKGIGGQASMLLERLVAEFDAVTYFLTRPVEPTNNFAERTLRPYVVARKNSFGATSEYGERWLERSLSLRMTCKLRDACYARALKEAVTNHLLGKQTNLSWLDSCVYMAS